MTNDMENNDIILPKTEGEDMRMNLICPECEETKRGPSGLYPFSIQCAGDCTFSGIIKCNRDKHEMPIEMVSGTITKLDTSLPENQSEKLSQSVEGDIKQDIREAERAHYARCYKACAAMCRRAVQLSLIGKDIKDKEFSKMLSEALSTGLLNQDTYQLAKSIKGCGDIAMHRNETIDSDDAKLIIHAAVRMLNEIFSKQQDSK